MISLQNDAFPPHRYVDARASYEPFLDLLLALPTERALSRVAAIAHACNKKSFALGPPAAVEPDPRQGRSLPARMFCRRPRPGTASAPVVVGLWEPPPPARPVGGRSPPGVGRKPLTSVFALLRVVPETQENLI